MPDIEPRFPGVARRQRLDAVIKDHPDEQTLIDFMLNGIAIFTDDETWDHALEGTTQAAEMLTAAREGRSTFQPTIEEMWAPNVYDPYEHATGLTAIRPIQPDPETAMNLLDDERKAQGKPDLMWKQAPWGWEAQDGRLHYEVTQVRVVIR